jgi:hypothetical protein
MTEAKRGKKEKSNKSKQKVTPPSLTILSNSDGWWAGRPTAGRRQARAAVEAGGLRIRG